MRPPSGRILELDRLVREARQDLVAPGADPGDVDLFEAAVSVVAAGGTYSENCAHAGLDSHDEAASAAMVPVMQTLRERVAASNADEAEWGRYVALVIARASAARN